MGFDGLNYHHLHYFRVVAEEGSIAAASRRLKVGSPAISMQIKQLEQQLGCDLLRRQGRGLALTDSGRMVQRYAADIFAAGQEMVETLRHHPHGRPDRLRVGIVDALPKLVAYRLLQPVLDGEDACRLECHEGQADRLFHALGQQELDLILCDRPLPPGLEIKAFNHRVGSSSVTLFATAPLARRYRHQPVAALDGAPFLMPAASSALRRRLDRWFAEQGIQPRIVAECSDSALLKAFGTAGRGVFPAPTAVAEEIRGHYRAQALHELEQVRERYYLISPERRIRHPAVARIVEPRPR